MEPIDPFRDTSRTSMYEQKEDSAMYSLSFGTREGILLGKIPHLLIPNRELASICQHFVNHCPEIVATC